MSTQLGVEDRRLVIEVIATLVHIKDSMGELILKPAGVPDSAYRPILYKRDATGRKLSKREIAPLIVEAIERLPNAAAITRAIICIAANWDKFYLADNEFEARATVQKAQEVIKASEQAEARETQANETSEKERLAQEQRDEARRIQRESSLLLSMFDEMARQEDHQRRGFLLEDLLNRLFALHDIHVVSSFRRNEGGEQIDAAFRLEGWHYLVECKWRSKVADIAQLDSLKGKIGRSGKQTMGLYLSINGWSENVPNLLKQNPDKSLFLMDGYDLRCVLSQRVGLRDLLAAKLEHLNIKGEPFFSAMEYLREAQKS